MTDTARPLAALLPYAAPDARTPRTMLVILRRMAIGGLKDAHASSLMMGLCGIGYRRPLMFARILMQEVSRVATRSIAIAPCCCPRMTESEAALLGAVGGARTDPQAARALLARATGSLDCLAAVSVAQGLASALDDLGRPFEL